jgi:hypothetical protein
MTRSIATTHAVSAFTSRLRRIGHTFSEGGRTFLRFLTPAADDGIVVSTPGMDFAGPLFAGSTLW